ncbi:MAG: 30S ribosome-binding factor RbfA [candidate division Zixibacteria bacterium]|nr:30S ribosome-binding factor RbfA [candidate division Zixibacteria bacterium]
MKYHRTERVADQILRDVAETVQHEVKDPKIGFVTFSRVEISDDLKFAKIFYTVLGSEEEQKNSRQALKRSRTFIQSRIGKKLGIRHTPEITFIFDKGLENSLRVNELLNIINEERQERESGSANTDRDQSSD